MSNLLLRRRAQEGLVKEFVEGGGPEDGRYVIFKVTATGWSSSADCGVSFQREDLTTTTYSASIAGLTPAGTIVYPSWNQSPDFAAISCKPWGTWGRQIKKPDGTQWTSSLKATAVSRNGDKLLVLGSKSGSAANIRPWTDTWQVSFELTPLTASYDPIFGEIYSGGDWVSATASTLEKVTETLPSWANSPSPAGFGLRANRNTLQYAIACPNARQLAGNRDSGSITYDGGRTWTPIEDVIFGTSSQGSNAGGLAGFTWSDDGRECMLWYGNPQPALYYSKDYGHTFNPVNYPTGMFGKAIQASEKFGTIYIGGGISGSLMTVFRSQDKGKSWTRLFHIMKSGNASGSCGDIYLECNAKGDRVIAAYSTSSNATSRFYYSHNYGLGFQQGEGTFKPHYTYVSVPIMSRDYRKFPNVDIPETIPTGSPEVQSKVFNYLTSINNANTVRVFRAFESASYEPDNIVASTSSAQLTLVNGNILTQSQSYLWKSSNSETIGQDGNYYYGRLSGSCVSRNYFTTSDGNVGLYFQEEGTCSQDTVYDADTGDLYFIGFTSSCNIKDATLDRISPSMQLQVPTTITPRPVSHSFTCKQVSSSSSVWTSQYSSVLEKVQNIEWPSQSVATMVSACLSLFPTSASARTATMSLGEFVLPNGYAFFDVSASTTRTTTTRVTASLQFINGPTNLASHSVTLTVWRNGTNILANVSSTSLAPSKTGAVSSSGTVQYNNVLEQLIPNIFTYCRYDRRISRNGH